MNVLVVNDDGYMSTGIKTLVNYLSRVHSVYVVAPDGQRSAMSHAISCNVAVKFEEIAFENTEKAYSITGFPADCVKVGLQILEAQNIKIDMVFSGINHGSNLGLDTHYSGTVGAALEGAFNDIPSVALSVVGHQAVHFDFVAELALKMSQDEKILQYKNMVFNVNAPDVPASEIKGIRISNLGRLSYRKVFEEEDINHCQLNYCRIPEAKFEDIPGSDAYNIKKGYATITPIFYDFTSSYHVDAMKGWKSYEV